MRYLLRGQAVSASQVAVALAVAYCCRCLLLLPLLSIALAVTVYRSCCHSCHSCRCCPWGLGDPFSLTPCSFAGHAQNRLQYPGHESLYALAFRPSHVVASQLLLDSSGHPRPCSALSWSSWRDQPLAISLQKPKHRGKAGTTHTTLTCYGPTRPKRTQYRSASQRGPPQA